MLTDLYNASQDQRVPPTVARTLFAAVDRTDPGTSSLSSILVSGTHRTSPSQLSVGAPVTMSRAFIAATAVGSRRDPRNDVLPLPLPPVLLLLRRVANVRGGESLDRWTIARTIALDDSRF